MEFFPVDGRQPQGFLLKLFANHGVGHVLMTHVIKQAEAKGLNRIYSEVSITARPFYKHMGFTFVNESVVLR